MARLCVLCALLTGCTLVDHVNDLRFVDGSVPAFFDDFNGTALGSGWTFGAGGDGSYSVGSGHLVLSTGASPQDVCNNFGLTCVRMLRPALAGGSGQVYQARFDGPVPTTGQAYGLFLQQEQDFLVFQIGMGIGNTTPLMTLRSYIGGVMTNSNQSFDARAINDLQVTRDAAGLKFSFRTDPAGLWSTFLANPFDLSPTSVGVFIGASTPSASFMASVDYFRADRLP